MRSAFITVFILCLCASAYPFSLFGAQKQQPDDKYIVLDVDGEGTSRSEAIESAWLEGIHQAVGSFIDSKTELNNDKLTERIISYSRGLVEKYEVLSVDDSQARDGIYRLKMRLWIVRDLLRDGAKHATAGEAQIAFSAEDLKRKQEELDAKALEARSAAAETAGKKSQTAADLLNAMLDRYKPEDFVSCYIPGKPQPIKDKPDMFTLKVEVNFNDKLYKESFVPDLVQVLDQIASVKKNTLLAQHKNDLRALANNKTLDNVKESAIMRFNADELKGEYSIAVYNRPERFGCRLYGFADADKQAINQAFSKFIRRSSAVRGLVIELIDEDKEVLETIESPFSITYLLTRTGNAFAVHPTILRRNGNVFSESTKFSVSVPLEMPEEVLPYVKNIKASFLITDMSSGTYIEKLGIYGADYPDGGVEIVSVKAGSPADQRGLKPGDVITIIDTTIVNTTVDLIRTMGYYRKGNTKVTLRDHRSVRVTL